MSLKKHNDIADHDLLEKYYAEADTYWLGVLLQRYTLLLLGVCMKYLKNEEEAKDAVQHVFLKVLNELPKYRVSYFKSWLYMVTKNHCLMKLRDKGKYTTEINDELLATPEHSDQAAIAEKELEYDQMAAALLLLNREQHECVSMFYLQKKSYQQISSLTGYTIMQVKSHIQNGKRNIKLQMAKAKQK